MSANATWWVTYQDKSIPYDYRQCLSLRSPDCKDTRKAIRRARDTAVARLAKKGIKAQIVSVRCVG
jgi:hypothetical protein